MTSRSLDPEVVQSRLALLERLLDDLDFAGDVSVERLRADRMLRHAIERILAQLVDVAVSVNSHVAATSLGQAPRDYRESFELMASAGGIERSLAERLAPSVGLCNVLAHEYLEIDLTIVARATREANRGYREYVRAVSGWLRRQ